MLPNIQLPQDVQDDTQNMGQGPSQVYSSSVNQNDQQSSRGARTPKSKKSRRMKGKFRAKLEFYIDSDLQTSFQLKRNIELQAYMNANFN